MKQNGKHTGGGAILESGQEVQLKKTEKKVYNVFDMGESALVGKGDFNSLKCLFCVQIAGTTGQPSRESGERFFDLPRVAGFPVLDNIPTQKTFWF